MNLYLVNAYDPCEHKGSNDRGAIVEADTAEEAMELWKSEYLGEDDEEDCLPVLDSVMLLKPRGAKGFVSVEIVIED